MRHSLVFAESTIEAAEGVLMLLTLGEGNIVELIASIELADKHD